jgi:hypothetical protein
VPVTLLTTCAAEPICTSATAGAAAKPKAKIMAEPIVFWENESVDRFIVRLQVATPEDTRLARAWF